MLQSDVNIYSCLTQEQTSLPSSPPSPSKDKPLDIPKEIWRLVDFLYKNGLEQVIYIAYFGHFVHVWFQVGVILVRYYTCSINSTLRYATINMISGIIGQTMLPWKHKGVLINYELVGGGQWIFQNMSQTFDNPYLLTTALIGNVQPTFDPTHSDAFEYLNLLLHIY